MWPKEATPGAAGRGAGVGRAEGPRLELLRSDVPQTPGGVKAGPLGLSFCPDLVFQPLDRLKSSTA